MQRKELPQAEEYISRNRRRRIWKRIAGGMACVAACATLFLLARPGLTMETGCGLEEHTHTEACYAPAQADPALQEGEKGDTQPELICGKEEHVHSEACLQEPASQQEETEETPTEEVPGEEVPGKETPEEEPSGEETPGEETSEEETPGEEIPEEETPEEEPSGEETPEEETPEEEAPGEEIPGEETPGEETPGEEVLEEETPENVIQEEGQQGLLAEIETLAESPDETSGETLQSNAVTGTAGGVEWSFSEDGKLVLSVWDTGILPTYEEVTAVPWFDYSGEIKSIEIQPGVSGIDGLSFALCQSLQEITTPEGENQEYLSEDGVLFNKDKTVLITCLPAKTGSYAVPETVTAIGDFAFAYCTGLTGIEISASVTEIGDYAFAYCTGLTAIEIPEGVTSLGEWLFMYCQNLESVTLPDGLTEISDYLFGACTKLTEIKIPASVTSIGVGAFASCTGLTEIEIPASVTSIGQQAFAGSGLKKATFQEGVTSIAPNVFYGCSSLTEVNLPESLTEIGESAFENSGLTSLTLPKSLASIGENAFQWCSALAEIRLETGGPVTVGKNAFNKCNALKTVTVSSSVKNLDSSILSAVKDSMETLKFEGPNEFTYTGISVVSVGDVLLVPGFSYTAAQDGTLTQGTASGTCGNQGDNVTWTLSGDGKLVISGTGAMEEFATAYSAPWYGAAELIRSVEVQEGVTSVSPYAFYGCKSMTQASLADSVTSLGSYSFYNCESLSDLRLPENLTEMGASAFERCDALSSVTIPGKVKKIGDYAFQDCVSLKTVTLGEGVQEIGQYAFDGCSSLEKVELNKGLLTIGNGAFYDCTSLAAADLPSTLTALGERAFYNCKALRSVVIPDGLEEIKSQTFRNCSSLAEVTLGKGLTAIGANAFQSCSGLKTVTVRTAALDGSIMGNSSVFLGCYGITNIEIANTVKELAYTGLTAVCTSSGRSGVTFAFQGENEFTYTGSSFDAKNVSLSAGVYTVDSQGRLGKSGTCENGLNWEMSPDGTLTISGNGTMKDFSYSGMAPWYKEFGQTIKKVVIEEGVQSVGDYAFAEHPSLEEVQLPESLSAIGYRAFSGCGKLTGVVIPDGTETIGSYAFYQDKNLETVVLPESLEQMESYLFDGCTSLKEITIPVNLKDVGYSVFGDCTGLEKVILEAAALNTNTAALSDCKALKEIVIKNTVKELDSTFLSGLPEDVTVTFEGPGNFTYVENYSITVGGRKLYPGEYFVDAQGKLFRSGSCGEEAEWILSEDGTLTIRGQGAMYDYSSYDTDKAAPWVSFDLSIEKIVVEEGITSIGSYAFYNTYNDYTNLKDVEIAGSVEKINEHAFYRIKNLDTVEFQEPSGLKEIGDSAFSSSGLTEIEIPDSVEQIGGYAFSGTSLASVYIPAAVTRIDAGAFDGCGELTIVTFAEESQLTAIGGSAFSETALTEIEIPAKVASIGKRVFQDCEQLEKVTFAEGSQLTTIGDSAFSGLPKLTAVELPDTVKSIGASAFEDTKLNSIAIPAGVTAIGDNVFSGCEDLKKVEFAEESQLESVGAGAFLDTAIRSLELPDTVKTIGDRAFQNTGLETIEIPASIESIGNYAFYLCEKLGTVTIPEESRLTSIGQYAFGNTAIAEILLPKNIESVGTSAFTGCTELEKVRLETEKTSAISSSAFSNRIKELEIGKEVEELSYSLLKQLGGYPCRLEKLVFEGNNDGFLYSGEDYQAETVLEEILLTDGVTYLTDEDGRLIKKGSCGEALEWLLMPDGTMKIQGSGAMQDYADGTEPLWNKYADEIKQLEIGSQVTEIGSYAFADCPNLEKVSFDENSQLTAIGDFAFYGDKPLDSVTLPKGTSLGAGVFQECSKLGTVNGETELKAVLEQWNAGLDAFYNTALWEQFAADMDLADGSISVTDENKRKISLEPTGGREMLTGENTGVRLVINGGEGDSKTRVRVYFAFANEGARMSFTPGDYEFEDDAGNKIKAVVRESAIPHVYYMEIPKTDAGDTLLVTIDFLYENFTPGGTALIWLSLLEESGDGTLDSYHGVTVPDEAFRFTWKTAKNEFCVTKESNASPKVTGGGAEGDELTVKNLYYTVAMTKADTGASSDYGKDIMTSARFVDTLTLPEHFYWRPQVLEAVKDGEWSVQNMAYGYRLSVLLDGTDYEIVRLMRASGVSQSSVKASMNDQGQLELSWEYKNSSSTSEIANKSFQLAFGEDVILADRTAVEKAAEKGTPLVCAFSNKVQATQTYAFSGETVKEAQAEPTAVIGSAGYDLKIERKAATAVVMGNQAYYTITLENNSSLPYTSLDYVEDPLNDYFYITPEDMETMLSNAEHGKDLTITLEDAALCTPMKKTVVGMNGNEYTVTQQQVGKNTVYDGENPASTEDERITAENVTIRFGWAEDGDYIQMEVTGAPEGQSGTFEIGEGKRYPDIVTALNTIGYFVDQDVTYHCNWNLKGQTLYSGEKREFQVRSTVKDTFMRLDGDLEWYIKDNLTYVSGVGNSAYSQNTSGEKKTASAQNHTLWRDFEMYKYAYWNDMNTPLEDDAAPDFKDGDVIYYSLLTRDYYSVEMTYAVPLTDSMEGSQALLASVGENTELSGKDLEKKEIDETEYYILSKPGTYHHVTIGGALADSVEVEKTEEGLSTLIRWYHNPGTNRSVTIRYPVLVMQDLAGEGEEYSLRNEVWLGGHQGHRLYDGAYFGGKKVVIEKHIVTNMETPLGNGIQTHDYKQDEWTGRSTVNAGDEVTYCLEVERIGRTKGTIHGSSMQDYLPLSLGNYWTKENVSVAYVAEDEMELEIKNPGEEGWDIVTDSQNSGQQILKWDEDFSMTLNGTVYIYVTLEFPDGEDWTKYTEAYGSGDIRNTFHLDDRQDEVFHDLSVKSRVMLQKGVYFTGSSAKGDSSVYTPSQNADSLWRYANDGQDYGIVTYYIALYNSGESRMYLSGIQDVLPKGFTYDRLYSREENIYQSTDSNLDYYESLLQIDGENTVYKSADIMAKTKAGVVTFSLSGSGVESSISYDAEREKYYLEPGEAVVFAYNCRTNGYENTQDRAVNETAMPYYDYNGAECELDTTSSTVRQEKDGLHANDGSRGWITDEQAELLGMDTTETADGTKWLHSEVAVSRGGIVPGITKTAEKSLAGPTEEIAWTLRVSNHGTGTMRDYTITDVMQAPYQFTGSVELRLQPEQADNSGGDYTKGFLFRFGDREAGDEKVTLIYRDEPFSSSKELKKEMEVNGDPVEIEIPLRAGTRNVKVTIEVALSRAEDGTEHLTLHFPKETADDLSVMPGSYAELTLHTSNVKNALSNKTYYNTAYLTPSAEQEFNKAGVTQGSYTLYEGRPSLASEANVAVSYGYATAAEKNVTELEESGEASDNTASSNSGTNYIVLSEKDRTFRYTLKVKNNGDKAMRHLVLLDNLPEPGDHTTFYEELPRLSEFQVDFAENPEFTVLVNGEPLGEGQYTLEYSDKTEFTEEDRVGETVEDWRTKTEEESLDAMRSFRLSIQDDSEETESELIPPGAEITVSFNAKVSGTTESSETAWNSFGYSYSLKDDVTLQGLYLEAAPQKVGVRMASIPYLSKKLLDSDGNEYQTPKNETFRFLIYKGEALPELESQDLVQAAEILAEAPRAFTRIDLVAEAGKVATEELELKDLVVHEYQNGTVKKTESPWEWENFEEYTILELPPQDGDGEYIFGNINGYGGNNMTFTYQASQPLTLECVNVRNVWTLQLFKKSAETQTQIGGAVFALYSQQAADQLPEDECAELTEKFGLDSEPERDLTIDGTDWYLKDIQESDEAYGAIVWRGLTKDRYYLLELRAPEGYKLNEQPGQIIEAPEGGTGELPITVHNSGYELPETGGPGTAGYILGGAALAAGALTVLAYRKRKKGSAV